MTRRHVTIACVLLAATLAAAQENSGPFRLRGVVVDAASGKPLSRVQVAVQPVKNRRDIGTVMTAADGRFAFDGVDAGKYALMAQRRGYPLQNYDEHENFSTAIAAGPGLDSEHIVFRLQPAALISGHITDTFHEPVRDATVVLLRYSIQEGEEILRIARMARTDDRGMYRIAGLSAATYFVVVSAQPWWTMELANLTLNRSRRGEAEPAPDLSTLNIAYPVTWFNQATEMDNADPIPVRPGDSITADIALTPVPALTLKFAVDRTQRARTFPTLQALLPNGQRLPLQLRQSGDGQNTIIAGFAPGHYLLTARTVEYNTNNSTAQQQSSAERELDITSDMDLSSAIAQAAADPRVSGSVRYLGDAPRRCVIQVRNRRTRYTFGAEVDKSGEFAFRMNVPPGEYDVFVAFAPDYYVKSVSAIGGKVSGRRVNIFPGDTVKLSVDLAYGMGQVDGTAQKNGKPLAGAMIVLVPNDPSRTIEQIRRDQSDSDGTFTLPNIIPGEYTIFAIENGWDLEWKNPAVLDRFMRKGQVVRIEPRPYTTTVEAQPGHALN